MLQLPKRSDFISLHVPLTPKTHHLISTKQLKAMKPTAFLINTSRGPIIDERALVQALKKDVIAGAALDVLECVRARRALREDGAGAGAASERRRGPAHRQRQRRDPHH